MITEKNSIKTDFSKFEEVQYLLTQKLFIGSVIALIVGAVGLAAYIATSVTYETLYGFSPAWCEALLVFAVPFVCGLISLITIRSQRKQSRKNSDATNVYEFFADCVILRELRGGVEVGVLRVGYTQVLKVREKKDYLLFYYVTKTSAFPIDKSKLSEAELNTIRKLFGRRISDGENAVELAAFGYGNGKMSLDGNE